MNDIYLDLPKGAEWVSIHHPFESNSPLWKMLVYIYIHESNQIFILLIHSHPNPFMSGSPTQASHLWRIILTFTVYPLFPKRYQMEYK